MNVIETLKQAIEGMTAERESASKAVQELTAKIGGIDTSIEAHYAHIGRMYCELRD